MTKRIKQFLALAVFIWFGSNVVYAQLAKEVKSVSITVSDLDQSIKFFNDVLSFKTISIDTLQSQDLNDLFGVDYEGLKIKKGKMQIGNEYLELIEYMQPTKGREIPLDSKSNDLWFQHIAIVTNDMDKAYSVLKKHKVIHVSTMPQELPDYIPAAAGIKAFYFQDPDGHNLEVIYFPKDKGNPKWQTIKSDSPFIGIDHTAIGISDTDKSTDFYSDVIGLKVAGNSVNYGSEQEHLNQVFGAHLLITGLVAQKGFGVEFLQYIAPPGGRPYPKDSNVTDLWHWHTTIKVKNIEAIYDKLLEENAQFISKKMVTLNKLKQFMVRDVNGHALLITQ